jgi:peptidoglycan/xylan/chitin deacetylase (PgdA/CDA1 family)/cell wall-associated NlpC family hydrolase
VTDESLLPRRFGGLARVAMALLWVCLSVSACGAPGAPPAASPSSSPGQSAWPSSSPSPSASPTPTPPIEAGSIAYVAVNVATGWHSPQSPRKVDAPALENPARIEDWVAALTAADQAGLIGRVDTQALLGDPVLVLKLESGWAQVVIPDQATPLDARGYPAWVPVRQLTAVEPPDTPQAVMVVKPTAVARGVTDATTLRLSFGTDLPVLGDDTSSYTVAAAGRAMLIDKSALAIRARPATASSIISTARSFLGLRYLWGGTSGFGYDCSGLVYSVFKAHGIVLPRDAEPQSKVGRAVARANLQAGDLVFFARGGTVYHEAIYAGQGMVLESPSPGLAVTQVSLASLPDYSGARRLLADAPPTPRPSPTPSPIHTGPPRSLSGAEWTKLPTTDKVVALTFDAGGNNAGVAPITRALRAAGVPATFFLTGRWTEVYPADAKAIAASYDIGNHTYNHPYLTQLSDAQVTDQVKHAERVIMATTGHDPRPFFRFPYGNTNARTLADVHVLGYGGIRWTVDTLGWQGKGSGQSTATVIQRVLAVLQPGEIVLMHVGAANDGSTLDADALPTLIHELRARGYRLVLLASYV